MSENGNYSRDKAYKDFLSVIYLRQMSNIFRLSTYSFEFLYIDNLLCDRAVKQGSWIVTNRTIVSQSLRCCMLKSKEPEELDF